MATSGAEFSRECQLLLKYKADLVLTLESVDLLELSEELCKTNFILEWTRTDFRNLDRRVDQNLKARYLFQLVWKEVCRRNTSFDQFLKGISRWHQMKHVYECLKREISDEVPERVKTLTQYDIPVLMNDLANAAHKWYEIGIAVNIPIIKLIEINNEKWSLTIKLHKVLTTWIIEGTSLKEVTPSKIKEVLASPLVGLPEIAENLSFKDLLPASKRPRISSSPGSLSTITKQSINMVVGYGKSTLLEIQVTSDKPVSCQWTKDCRPLSDGTSYQGTSSSILLVSHRNMASRHIEGRYVCVVKGIGRSREISVTIEYPESIQHLLDRYSSLGEVPEDSWPQVKVESFVDLALINKTKSDKLKEFDYSVRGDMDDILYQKQEVSYEKSFGKYKSKTLLVVEGRPGVGKTTLAHKVTKDWSAGDNVLVGADLVFLVSLRLLNVNKTNNIFELLRFNSDKSDKDMIKDFESEKGLRCCFVLDGLDEYRSNNDDKVNFVYDLIKKEIAKAMVIVFSRPIGKKKLEKCKADVDRRIEILGFKSDQITHYISTYFQHDSQKAEKLMKYLKGHINVLHMCYLPVHVAMICYIHSQYEDSSILNTETQIYECFAMLTIIRKLRRECGSEVSNQPTSFQSLNDKDKKNFIKVCKLAFDMCVDQRQVFESSNNEIMLTDESGSDEPSLGLVTIDSTAKLYNYHDIYAFLHLTFQEYLAAYHIFSQTSDQQLSIIDQHKDSDAMLVVWKFYCGLVGQNNIKFHDQVQAIFSSKHADTLYRVRCAFESQQPAICDAAIDYREQRRCLSFQNKIFTAGDYNAISYVMSEASGPTSKLAFYSCTLQVNGVKRLIETIRNNRLQQISAFVFHSPDPTFDQFQSVNFLLRRMVSLEVLDLYKTILSQSALTEVAGNVILPHLKCIKIKVQVPFEFIENYFQLLTFTSKPDTVYYHIKDENGVYDKALKCAFSSSILIKYEESLEQYLAYLSNLKLKKNLNLDVFAHCSTFYFANCSINDHKIITLSESLNSNSIEKLVFDFNEISQGAVALVSICAKLKHLSIRCNSIDDEGAKSLAGAVHECTDLVYLDLEYNCFGDEGAIAIASAVSHLNIDLYLWNANITETGVTSVLRYVSSANIHSPQICDFEEVNTLDPDSFDRAIKCYASITGIKLYRSHLNKESVQLLRDLHNLEWLYIIRDYFTRDDISFLRALFDLLKSLANLQTLDVSCNNIVSEGAVALADGLKYCINLQKLNIRWNCISMEGAAALADALKYCRNLQSLDINGNSIGSDDAAALADGLKSCISLSTLNISGNSIGSEGAAALVVCLKSCTNLKTLDISQNNIGSDGLATLADGLKSCTNLQMLDFSYNSIGSEGAAELAKGLKSCTNLLTLNISENHIGSESAAALVGGLKSCTNLRTLDISRNGIGSELGAALAGSLKCFNNFKSLDISRNSIGSEGVAALSDGLKSCTNLEMLDISWNSIGSEGAAALSDGLKSCTNLEMLDISWNSIGSEGAAALADGLKFCTNLQALDINENSIGSEGAAALADGINLCSNLQLLNISWNSIGSEGTAALSDGLKSCTNLQLLDIGGNDREGIDALVDCLKSCPNLKILR